MIYDVTIDGKTHRLKLQRTASSWRCWIGEREVPVDAVLTQPNVLSVIRDGKAHEVTRDHHAGETFVSLGGRRYRVEVSDPRSLRGRRGSAGDESGPRKITAPMPGKVVRVLVAENMEVKAGQGVMVVEAMKMQNEVKSPKKGKIQRLTAVVGAAVNAGDILAIVE